MDIIIEKATAQDAEQLLEYLKRIGGETDNLSFGAEGLGFSVESESEYLESLKDSKDGVMLLAKHGEKIVGNASLNRYPRRMRHRGELSVTVLKEYWNHGIGSMLMEKTIEFAKENGFDIIDLQVRSDNSYAIHLYEKYGFKRIGEHPEFFKINNNSIAFVYMYLKVR